MRSEIKKKKGNSDRKEQLRRDAETKTEILNELNEPPGAIR
jgi:hypothetical protein